MWIGGNSSGAGNYGISQGAALSNIGAGSITLTGTATLTTGSDTSVNALNITRSIWLGSDSVLDVSGISLIDGQAPIVLGQSGLVRPQPRVVCSKHAR